MSYQYYIGGIAQALENSDGKRKVNCVVPVFNSANESHNEPAIKKAGHTVFSNVSENLAKPSKKRKLKDKSSDERNGPRKKIKGENVEQSLHNQVERQQSQKRNKIKVKTKTHNQQTYSVNEPIDNSETEHVQVERKISWKKISKNRVKMKTKQQKDCSGNEQQFVESEYDNTEGERKQSGKKMSKNRRKTMAHVEQTCSVNEQTVDSEYEHTQVERKPSWKKNRLKRKLHHQQTSVNEETEDSEERIEKNSLDKSADDHADPEKEARTVFVGNLPLSVTRKDLKTLFSCYGKVQSVRRRSVVPLKMGMPKKVAAIQNKFNSEKESINAYVVMDNVESANKALVSNGTLLQGHHIRVDLAGTKEHDHRLSVFVGNLPFNCQDEELHNFFSQSFEIESVRVVRDSETGISKGFGFVMFKSKDSVELAMKMDKEFKGRHLRVMRSKKQQKKQSKTREIGMQKFEEKMSFQGIKSSKGVKERKRMQRKIKFANIANKQKTKTPDSTLQNTNLSNEHGRNANISSKQKASGASKGGRNYGNAKQKVKTPGDTYEGERTFGNPNKAWAPRGIYKGNRTFGNSNQKTRKPGGTSRGDRTFGNSNKAWATGGTYKGNRAFGNPNKKARTPGGTGDRTFGNPNKKAWVPSGTYKGDRTFGNPNKARTPGGTGTYKGERPFGNPNKKAWSHGGTYKGDRTFGNCTQKARTPRGPNKGGRTYGKGQRRK